MSRPVFRTWLPIEREYEYRFTEYEYDFNTIETGDQREVSDFLAIKLANLRYPSRDESVKLLNTWSITLFAITVSVVFHRSSDPHREG